MEPNQFSICTYAASSSGGHARYTQEVLSALSEVGRKEGVQVSLITSEDLDSKYRTSPYPIHDILPPLRPRTTFRSPVGWGCSRIAHYYNCERIFLRWLKKHDEVCDGIHFQDYPVWFAPRHFRTLKARGKRVFYSVHNIYPHNYRSGKPKAYYSLRNSWARSAQRSCDALFVHSEHLRRQLSEFLGVGHPPIFVTPHGIWNIAADTSAVTNAKKRLQRRQLLFFGVIRRNKGLHTLLRAMEGLVDCTLIVAGQPEDPRYQEQVRTMVEQLPPGRVELIDRFIEDDEMTRLFDQSSLVILPYASFAAQSGVLHDALAYGLPVVATDVGALGESVRRWGIGEIVSPNNDVALARAIREMLTSHRYLQASEAADRVRTDLTWEHAAELTIEAYRSVWRDGSEMIRA